jgi:flagellar biosynthesis anti-sigma factor FlgM
MKGVSGNPALDAYNRMAISPVGGANQVTRPEPEKPVSPAPAAAEVNISARARELASGGDAPPVDAQKVEELKNRIAEGTYSPDSATIAKRMLDAIG